MGKEVTGNEGIGKEKNQYGKNTYFSAGHNESACAVYGRGRIHCKIQKC